MFHQHRIFLIKKLLRKISNFKIKNKKTISIREIFFRKKIKNNFGKI